MKIAISATGKDIDSDVDQRFGRCPYFILAEIEGKKMKGFKAADNKGAAQGHGAGIMAAQQLGEEKADAVITGNVGPNASDVLKQLKIKAYQGSGKIKEAIELFMQDKLDEIKEIAAPHTGVQPVQSNSERIFFPLLNNNGEDSEISQHFGHAPFFGVYDTEKKKLEIIENVLDHTDPAKSPIDQIEEAVNPTIIFALGIGARAINIIAQKGMKLKTGNYRTVREAVANLDKLEDQSQSCGHHH